MAKIKKKRRMKKMKMSFKDALFLLLPGDTEKEERLLLTAVSKKVFGVDRTYGNMKRRSKSALIQLFNKKTLKKKVLSSGSVYWSMRQVGEESITFVKNAPKKTKIVDYFSLRLAGRNIALLEKTLAMSFADRMLNRYADKWLLHIPDEMRGGLLEFYRRKYHKNANTGVPYDLLALLGINDFFLILNNDRSLFENILKSTQEEVTMRTHLKELSLIRNKIQHNYEVDKKDLLYFNVIAERVLNKFTNNNDDSQSVKIE